MVRVFSCRAFILVSAPAAAPRGLKPKPYWFWYWVGLRGELGFFGEPCAEETCCRQQPINFQRSLVRMLPLGKCLKLTLASGATALGSAWRAALIYQTDPLR
jgi:hypothetical protein